jgi:hypothetical protein
VESNLTVLVLRSKLTVLVLRSNLTVFVLRSNLTVLVLVLGKYSSQKNGEKDFVFEILV